MKKKVAFVLPKMALGGTEKSLLSLLDTLSENEYDITVLLFQKEGELLDQIPEWVHVAEVPNYQELNYDFSESPFKLVPRYFIHGKPIKASNLLIRHLWYRITKDRSGYFAYCLKNNLYDEPFDVAIAYLGPYDFLTAYVLYCLKAKEKIQWIHFDVSKYVFSKETCRKLYNQFDRIHVVSEGAGDAMVSVLPELQSKTYVVKNVISAKRCKEMALMGEGFTDGFQGVRILTVGRLSEEKGQDIIPEVASLLKQSGLCFRWYIIGEGPLLEVIEENIAKNDVNDEVVFLGAKKNPYPFYNESNIYVQTSVHEGFCITLAEAKDFELKIVSTDFTGAHEQLDNYKLSRIVNRDAYEMSKSIINFC